MHNERWFRGVRATPERERVYFRMSADDEGLGPRAFACLCVLADGGQPPEEDIDWLTSGLESSPIARLRAGRCVLSAFGRILADATDRGDWQVIYALTTMPELLEEAR